MHITEVKTRSSSAYGEPESFVNQQKIELLVKATDFYIKKKDLDVEIQFDIISIVKNNAEFSLKLHRRRFLSF